MKALTAAILLLSITFHAHSDPIDLVPWFWVDGESLWDDSNCPNDGAAAQADSVCWVESDVGLAKFEWLETCNSGDGCWFPVFAASGDEYIRPWALGQYFDGDGFAGYIYVGIFPEVTAQDPWSAYQNNPICLDFHGCISTTNSGWGGGS